MNQNRLMAIGIVAAAGLSGAAWALLPTLRSDQRKVEDRAAIELERARRLLHEYQPSLARHALLLDELRGVHIESADPDQLSEQAVDDYQRRHTAMWEAFQPHDWTQDPPLPRRPAYGDVTGQIRQGLNARERLTRDNLQLLDEAMRAVDAALAVTVGTASARTLGEANELKAAIYYAQGIERSLRTAVARGRSNQARQRLVQFATEARGLVRKLTLVADSAIDEQISTLQQRIEQDRNELADKRDRLAELDQTIRDMEKRLADAEARRAEADQALRTLQEEGLDFADPDGPAEFRRQVLEWSRRFREADRTAHALETGDYPHAHIDASGDYLSGRYLENGSPRDLTIEHGLFYYRNERKVLANEVAIAEDALGNLDDDLARLRALREKYAAAQSDAQSRLEQIASSARAAFDELNRLDSEAFALEESALEALDKSARTAQNAANQAQDWINQAREQTQALSPTAAERSAFREREDDNWLGGFRHARAADARIAKAAVHLQRYIAYADNARILEGMPDSIRPGEADAGAETAKADAAKEAGVEEVKQAIASLQRAHRDADRHWTLVAQAAAANDMLARFGFDQYVAEAVQAYRSAIQGREEAPAARPFAARLQTLEGG